MNELANIWKTYNYSAELLKGKLGRTSNLVGEYAEYLTCQYVNGEMLPASNRSADVIGEDGIERHGGKPTQEAGQEGGGCGRGGPLPGRPT